MISDPIYGILLGRISKSGSTITVVDSNPQVSKVNAQTLNTADLVQLFSLSHFEVDGNGKISLKTQISNARKVGFFEKTGDQTLKILTKYEKNDKKYNIIAIENSPIKFLEGSISLASSGLNGRIGSIVLTKFQSNKALVFAILDGGNQYYGFYPLAKSQIANSSYDAGTNKTSLGIQPGDGYFFNQHALFKITELETGQGEIVEGSSRTDVVLTILGALKNTYNFAGNTVIIEQINNFEPYNPSDGSELYPQNYAFTGKYVDVDGTGNIIEDFVESSDTYIGKDLYNELVSGNKKSHDTVWINCTAWSGQHLGDAVGGDVNHGLNTHLYDFSVRIFITPTGIESNYDAFEVLGYMATPSVYGLSVHEVSQNSVKVQTGASGLSYITDTGASSDPIDVESMYYRVVVRCQD